MNRSGALVGVDVGGTKVAVLVTDAGRTPLARREFASDLRTPDATVAGILAAIRATVAEAGLGEQDVAAVGIGVPGWIENGSGVVRRAVNLHWVDMPLGAIVERELGVPTTVENDVRAAAAGLLEHELGAGAEDLAYVSVGTGVSAGVVLGRRLHRGARGMAGEIGHVVVDPDGAICRCGLRGCLETITAGPAVARLAEEAVAAGEDTVLSSLPSPLTAETVYGAAADGDAVAIAIADRVGRQLGRALIALVLAYDLERIVLGGGVSRAGDPFLAPILREIGEQSTASALVAEMFPASVLRLVPPGVDAATAGTIVLAAAGLADHGADPSTKSGR